MIGFFDSGVGGLTILEAVRKRLPEYDTRYLGDTAHAPYGHRSQEEILELTWNGCLHLFAQGCDLIIIACNTASAVALREIQQKRLPKYPGKKILGIIRPTVESLAKRGHKRIAVLSTVATKKSEAYVKEFANIAPDVSVYSQACPNWVGFVEARELETPAVQEDVKREILNLEMHAGDADAILLACTHFPYLKKQIESALKKPLPIYEQGSLVAESLADYLQRHPEIESKLSKGGGHQQSFT